VLVNVWDAVSARVVASQPGCEGIATASWSVAAAHGYPDGEQLPPDVLFTAIGEIADAVELPVTADLEGGYGMAGEAVRLAIEAGAVGCNLEDGAHDGPEALVPFDAAIAAIDEAVTVGLSLGVPLVINARTDAFLRDVEDAFDVAVARGRAFLGAGADCVFVPGVTDGPTIDALVEAIGPVSVLATPASPPLDVLASIGVRRVSFGPGPLGVAMAALGDAAATLLGGGPYPAQLAFRPPGGPAPSTRDERWQRAVEALVPFVQEWGLTLGAEELEEMAYAVVRHLNSRASLDEIDAEVRSQITAYRLDRRARGDDDL
jgi:2-methylisocitrate lyase-like PEP mutase family enzyme